MAKIDRKTQKIFGESAGSTGITEYGTPASGSPTYSTDLDNIQTSDWLTGWAAAATAGREIPAYQDFNAIQYVSTKQIAYLFQEGVAEYDAGTEYHKNSIVKKSGTYELYGSKINSNTDNALPVQVDDANWEYLGTLTDLGEVPDGSVTTVKIADDAVTEAKLATAVTPLGVGQTWTDVKASRAASTTYTNSTGKPIMVCISTVSPANSSSSIEIMVDSSIIIFNGSGTSSSQHRPAGTVVVPNGSTYSVTANDGTIEEWQELR